MQFWHRASARSPPRKLLSRKDLPDVREDSSRTNLRRGILGKKIATSWKKSRTLPEFKKWQFPETQT